jgi:hypothetical protein
MSVTAFQKIATDHVGVPNNERGTDPDYPNLARGGFEAIYFRPECGPDLVASWIKRARSNVTWRGQPFDGNVWFADPISADSQQAGIPTDATGWANYIVKFIKDLTARSATPTVLKLNTEFSFKGFPPWKANAKYYPWQKIYAVAGGKRYLYYTSSGGTSGTKPLTWPTQQNVKVQDGTVQWYLSSTTPYNEDGWNFCETVAKVIRTGLPKQYVITQPMSSQGDFNRGAFFSRYFRESPQCYGDQPYNAKRQLNDEIWVSSNDGYSMSYYGVKMDRRFVHPTIGAYGQGGFYAPSIETARKSGPFGFAVYRSDALQESDYVDYNRFKLP